MDVFGVQDLALHLFSFVHWDELKTLSLVCKSLNSLVPLFKQQQQHGITNLHCIGPFVLYFYPDSKHYRINYMPVYLLQQWNDFNSHTFWQNHIEDSWYLFSISSSTSLFCFKKVNPTQIVWRLSLANLYVTQLNQDAHHLFIVCQSISTINGFTKVMIVRKWDGTVLTDLISKSLGNIIDCWVLHNDTIAVLYQPQANLALMQQILFFKKCKQSHGFGYELFYTMDCNNMHSFVIQGTGFLTSPNYYRLKERTLALDGRPSFQNAIVLQLLQINLTVNSVQPFVHTIFCEYNFQVLFSKLGIKYWLFFYYDVSKFINQIRVLDISTQQVYHCKQSRAFILLEQISSGECIGFVEPLSEHILYTPFASNCVLFAEKDILQEEEVTNRKIQVPNLPHFHSVMFVEGYVIPKSTIAVVVLAGEKGCFAFGFDTQSNSTHCLWSATVIVKTEQVSFSAFDITMQCRIIANIDLSILVTVKGIGFFHHIIRCSSGVVIHKSQFSWKQWSNELETKWTQTDVQALGDHLNPTKQAKQCNIN